MNKEYVGRKNLAEDDLVGVVAILTGMRLAGARNLDYSAGSESPYCFY